MARLIGNVDATGSLSTSVSTPVTNASAVSLYLPFDSNVNDASANGHSVTASGNAAISNSQAKFGSYSLLLDGTGDYLTISDDASLEFGSSDLTIEAFFYENDNTGHMIVQKRAANGGWSSGAWLLAVNAAVESDADDAGKIQFWAWDYNSTAVLLQFDNGAALSSGWHHLCVTRSGDTWRLFLDGRQVATNTWSGSIGNASHPVTIGRDTYAGRDRYYANCFIDDLRLIKGIALYTQNFVPPSQAVGASMSGANETNSTTGFTSVYLPFDSDVNDDGPLSLSVTAAGGAGISSAQSKFGGYSALFDGTDDALVVSNSNDDFDFGTGDFSIELFFNQTSNSSRNDITGTYSGSSTGWGISTNASNTNEIQVYFGNNVVLNSGASAYSLNQWHHLAVCRAGSSLKLFIDGVNVASASNTTNIIGGNNLRVGAVSSSANATFLFFAGYIDDYRILKGFAKYTAPFTPPTSAVTATVSQTRNDLAVLYLPFDDGLEDKARNHPVTANGNAAISATQAKFGGKSLSLDGTGDYLDIPNNSFHFGSDDLTVECWLYHSRDSQSSQATFLDFRNSSSNGFSLTIDANGRLGVYSAHIGNVISASSSTEMSKNAWHHFAYCRSGTTGKIFVDGTELGSATDNSDYANTSLRIGARYTGGTQYYVGYIDDILISKKAKYTSAFTAPSAASGGEVTDTTTDSRTFSSVWNLNSAVVAQNFKGGTWPGLPSSTVTVQVFGAGGAGGAQNAGNRGGNGGIVKASKSLELGTVLKIVVGNGGVGWSQANTGLLQGNTSDPMRGGDIQADVTNQTGGQGGSGSGVFVTSVAHGNAQVIAGGGGGGAGNNSARGGDSHSGTGASDSLNGGNGTGNSSYRGQGATTSGGGSANGSGSGAGAALLGGHSGTSSSVAGPPYNSGGSGGGGWYGGSGAGHGNSSSQQGGGGAGSGYVDSSWTRLSASGMTPKAGSSNANDNPADGADGAVIVTDGAGTTTYSTPGTYDHTVS